MAPTPREEVVHDVVGLVGALGIARQATGQAGNHSLGVVDDKLCGHVAEDAVDHAARIRVLHKLYSSSKNRHCYTVTYRSMYNMI